MAHVGPYIAIVDHEFQGGIGQLWGASVGGAILVEEVFDGLQMKIRLRIFSQNPLAFLLLLEEAIVQFLLLVVLIQFGLVLVLCAFEEVSSQVLIHRHLHAYVLLQLVPEDLIYVNQGDRLFICVFEIIPLVTSLIQPLLRVLLILLVIISLADIFDVLHIALGHLVLVV